MQLTPIPDGLRLDDEGQRVGEVTWHDRQGRRIVDHTWVHPRLRGHGVAAQLMEAAAARAATDGVVLDATCSYAVAWLAARSGRS